VAGVGRPDGGGALTTDLARLLAGPVEAAARGLLGALLRAHGVTVRISETEAYAGPGADPASHAHRGPTRRNAVMFGPPGYAYVYFTYGMHWCVNIVCGPPGEASAVLLRAGEVVDGEAAARTRRPVSAAARDLARGPARLASALGVDGSVDRTPVLGGGPLLLLAPPVPVPARRIAAGPRVGVTGAHDVPWRFWIADDPTVSAYRRHAPRGRPATGAAGSVPGGAGDPSGVAATTGGAGDPRGGPQARGNRSRGRRADGGQSPS
jgi:DNA-3-methyladenine glycosylase